MKKLKAGVIGLGVGERHVRAYNDHPQCDVVSICDFNPKQLRTVQQRYPNAKALTEADEVLFDPEIDVVSIASFDNYHYEQIVKAIENNKHIMVEKPFCLYEGETRRIREMLKDKPEIKVSSNLVLRTVPRFRWLKESIMNEELGQVYYVEGDYNYGRIHKLTDGWRGDIDFYSVFYGGGVHLVDLLLWLTDDQVVEVAAFGNGLSTQDSKFQYNDISVAILKFKSGTIGKVTANFSCVYPHFHCLNIYGTKATFVNDLKEGKLFRSRDPNIGADHIDVEYPGVSKGEVISSFVDYILYGSAPAVTKEDVFKLMSICHAVEKALGQSGSIIVEYI